MFCKFCGTKVDDNALFCSACGSNLGSSQGTVVPVSTDSPACDRTITVTRLSRLAAAIMKVEVFCDDEYMGILKVGDSISFDVDSQVSHKVYAVCNSSTSTAVGVGVSKRVSAGNAITATGKSGIVQIKPGTDDIKLNLYLKMGLTTPNVIIERV